MAIAINRLEFRDVEVLRYGLMDAPIDIVQVEKGPMVGNISHFTVGSVGVSTGNYSRGVRSLGLASERRWAFNTMLDTTETALDRLKVKAGDQAVIHPDREYVFTSKEAGNYVTIFIEYEEILLFLETMQPGMADLVLWRETISAQVLDPVAAKLRIQNLKLLLTALVAEARILSPETVDFHKRNILELVAAPFTEALQCRSACVANQDALVKDALHYLKMAGPRPVHPTELYETFNVEERALYRAFKDVLGIPPVTYGRIKRLNDVHTALLYDGDTIREVFVNHGFLHFGRASNEYKQLFGERPTDTRKRAAKIRLTRP
jgi:AraC family ethanolamine operon transcriptional activator